MTAFSWMVLGDVFIVVATVFLWSIKWDADENEKIEGPEEGVLG